MTCFRGEDFYIVVFWVMALLSLVYGYDRFSGTRFVNIHGKKVPRKLQSLPTRQHGVINPEDGNLQ
jgi:hypothetical protein